MTIKWTHIKKEPDYQWRSDDGNIIIDVAYNSGWGLWEFRAVVITDKPLPDNSILRKYGHEFYQNVYIEDASCSTDAKAIAEEWLHKHYFSKLA